MASTLLYSTQRPPFCKGNPITLKYAILDDASFVTQVAPCKAKSQKPAFSVFQFTNVATAHCVGWKFSYFNFFVKFLPPLSLFKKDLDCRMASFHEKSYSVTIALCLVLCLVCFKVMTFISSFKDFVLYLNLFLYCYHDILLEKTCCKDISLEKKLFMLRCVLKWT